MLFVDSEILCADIGTVFDDFLIKIRKSLNPVLCQRQGVAVREHMSVSS